MRHEAKGKISASPGRRVNKADGGAWLHSQLLDHQRLSLASFTSQALDQSIQASQRLSLKELSHNDDDNDPHPNQREREAHPWARWSLTGLSLPKPSAPLSERPDTLLLPLLHNLEMHPLPRQDQKPLSPVWQLEAGLRSGAN